MANSLPKVFHIFIIDNERNSLFIDRKIDIENILKAFNVKLSRKVENLGIPVIASHASNSHVLLWSTNSVLIIESSVLESIQRKPIVLSPVMIENYSIAYGTYSYRVVKFLSFLYPQFGLSVHPATSLSPDYFDLLRVLLYPLPLLLEIYSTRHCVQFSHSELLKNFVFESYYSSEDTYLCLTCEKVFPNSYVFHKHMAE